MKNIILLLLIIFNSNKVLSQTIINLDRTNGVYTVPCKVNGIPMDFIFDTGASNVTISLTEATFLIKQGLLEKNDIKETVKYQIANGDVNEGTNIILREIEVAGLKIKNIKATIVHEQNAPLLLGMSALNQLGKIEINNNKLIINDFSNIESSNSIDLNKETQSTIEWINSQFVKHRYETKDSKQKQNIISVKEIEDKFYLYGIRHQDTQQAWGFKQEFLIPLDKINNIDFEEKKYNYWLIIKIKNNEEAITVLQNKKSTYYYDNLGFIFNKSIDNENLKPKIKRAFEYIVALYNSKKDIRESKKSSSKNTEIEIKYPNGLLVFNVFNGSDTLDYKEDKEYYWYTEYSKVKSTKGGNGGKLLNGNYRFYDTDGNLISIKEYSMGLLHGESKLWNDNGELIEIENYKNGDRIYWKYLKKDNFEWIEHKGKLFTNGYIRNEIDGKGHFIKRETIYIDQKDIIKEKKIKKELYYKDSDILKRSYTISVLNDIQNENILIGKYQSFYRSGKIKVLGNYFDNYTEGLDYLPSDLKEGKWIWFLENGEVDSEENYKVEKEYWKNGSIKNVYRIYLHGDTWVKDGHYFSYNENGELRENKKYSLGKLISDKK
ncbi:TIGR02281 family clan AA aspartic protease [Winogradskyella sp.]|uniref:TIGR02281 family clan AA aspartic protease n=1 Tax=Winogradskyella sp. TaxID=1883156 RepID=UPI003AB539F5